MGNNIFANEKSMEYSQESIEFENCSNPQGDDNDIVRSSSDSPLKTLMPKILTYKPPNYFNKKKIKAQNEELSSVKFPVSLNPSW